MENTLENKGKFFAQYWGQKVFGSPYLKGSWHYTGENFDEIDESVWMNLKPLSSITDEDAIEVANILGIDNDAMVHHGKLFVDRIMGKRAGNSQDNCYLTYTSMWACDYLRSKGYALPYMGLSVEKQIEYGWIKLLTP